MALKGTLEDFGIADIFQLIGQQQKTGLLILTRNEHVVHILFREGSIVSAEVKNREITERLGQMTLQAGLITDEQLNHALDVQKKTLQKIGSILLENNFVKKSDLDEFIYLQTKETIFRLFRWNRGTYEFQPGDAPPDSEYFQPISAEHILMDGFRIIDEWPALRSRIGSFDNIYEHVPGKSLPRSEMSSDVLGDMDRAFPMLDAEESPIEVTEKLDPNAERLLEVINGQRNVTQIIAVSRLGEFDACRALVNLLDLRWIQQVKSLVAEEGDESDKLSIDLYQDYESPKRSYIEVLSRGVSLMAACLVFLFVLSYLGLGPFKLLFRSSRLSISRNIYHELMSDYHMRRLRTNLDLYYLKNDHYPAQLKEILTLGMLQERDLKIPWREPYIYESDGASYTLLKPLY